MISWKGEEGGKAGRMEGGTVDRLKQDLQDWEIGRMEGGISNRLKQDL